MSSRKFKPRCDSDKQTIPRVISLRETFGKMAFVSSSARYSAINFAISMANLAQKFGENPRHVPWNYNNTEFKGGRQSMMCLSCMKAVFYENTPYLHSRKKYNCAWHWGVSLKRKPASQQVFTVVRSDSIRCVAVMKLARSVLANVYVPSVGPNIWMKYMQLSW